MNKFSFKILGLSSAIMMAGCSTPATEAEIRAAVNECSAVLNKIENQITPKSYWKFGAWHYEEAKPVTVYQLKSYLSECDKEKAKIAKLKAEPDPEEKAVGNQVSVLAQIKYENEMKHAKSMAYLDSQAEDNAQ